MSGIGISDSAVDVAGWLLRCVGAGSVLITETLEDRHVVHAHRGPRLPEHLRHELPIGYPVCEHTVAMGFPLVVDDAFNHPLLRGNPAVSELGIGSYAGAPMFRENGEAAGTVCAMLPHIHRWRPEQIEAILTATKTAEKLLFRSRPARRWY
ncbi:GAF domain-containing protein [uncultured Roseobacter sp.]|uniref:GAF domain-containing protein n=1 Tax=uncultured Roseobacter sp. TaxID=114847 RepID=UPI00262A1590|nr:GAF domain-containing protein [uncultured Roseobacter sp.]